MSSKVSILLELELHPSGGIRTGHHPATPEDAERLKEWPSGGLAHLALGLLVEALRRESYLMAITQMSLGKAPEELDVAILTKEVTLHLMQNLELVLPNVCQETLRALQVSEA